MGRTHLVETAGGRSDATARHILLVEDDARVSMALRLRLEADGHRVSGAANLARATDGMLDERPDVVVLDINLPDGNGLALAARMRLLRATADLPLVVITASRDPAYRERASRLGVAFLEKPFASGALLDAIEQATSPLH